MRTIAVVTSSRADYSHLYWPLKRLAEHPDIDLRLIAMGPHLAPEFGMTVGEIERDGLPVYAKVECLLSSDSDIGMAKTIGVATLSFADLLGSLRPDLLLITADRYEMLAPAAVALALRVPVAHIEGGEISEGAIDDAVRNALTKLSHVHFTSTETARQRVIAMGEEAWRVRRAGAPSLDHIRQSRLFSREELERRLGIRIENPAILATLHPVTLARDTTREAQAFFEALLSIDARILFCYPNADAGSRAITDRVKAFIEARPGSHLFVNLDPVTYWSLLSQVSAVVGNSSSGIMEAASFGVPVVDIGIRQHGRERGVNVLDAKAEPDCIRRQMEVALSEAFRRSVANIENPYGDGCSAARITEVLASVSLGEKLLRKRGYDLA